MREVLKKGLILTLMVVMTLAMTVVPTYATVDTWVVNTYVVTNATTGTAISGVDSLTKDTVITVDILLNYTGAATIAGASVTRQVDSFAGGSVSYLAPDDTSKTLSLQLTGLKYKGTGDSLKFMINVGGTYEEVALSLPECKEYVEPTPVTPTPTPDPEPTIYACPTIILSRTDLDNPVREGDEFTVTVNIKNKGSVDIKNAVCQVTTTESLMLMENQEAFELATIGAGKSVPLTLKLKALKGLTNPSQYINCDLSFEYMAKKYTAYKTENEAGTASGKVMIPCEVKEEKKEEEKTTVNSPVPNMIVTGFNYGKESVAAGSEFTFSFTFRNTSKKLDCENMVVTVDSTGFTPNGASNTFYFSKVGAGESKTISMPMKAQNMYATSTENINIAFSYEYVEKKVRNTGASASKISVPVYNKDRFEISAPVIPGICYTGEEISITMNYVNKGKSAASNVEATIEGDITTPNPTQIIGNIESGRNGQFAFALTPNEAGECNFTVTVSYEDANENQQERVFPVIMQVEDMPVWDEPVYDDPGMDEPVKQGIPWKWIIPAVVVAGIVALIIFKKKRKAKKAKKSEDLQWKAWEEEFAKEDQKAAEADAPKTEEPAQEATEDK